MGLRRKSNGDDVTWSGETREEALGKHRGASEGSGLCRHPVGKQMIRSKEFVDGKMVKHMSCLECSTNYDA